jgi:hypothetical protein
LGRRTPRRNYARRFRYTQFAWEARLYEALIGVSNVKFSPCEAGRQRLESSPDSRPRRPSQLTASGLFDACTVGYGTKKGKVPRCARDDNNTTMASSRAQRGTFPRTPRWSRGSSKRSQGSKQAFATARRHSGRRSEPTSRVNRPIAQRPVTGRPSHSGAFGAAAVPRPMGYPYTGAGCAGRAS